MTIPFPQIDPVAIHIPLSFELLGAPFGPFGIHWYALAYLAGFVLGYWYFKRLNRNWPASPAFSDEQIEDLFFWIIVGVVFGGRLGYVLFYNLPYFAENPLDALKVWQGGMSFHGGALGAILLPLMYCKRKGLSWLDAMDRLAPSVCFGIFFGRLANFINGELYGRVTNVPWAMIFPHSDGLPRHPSQLYEAALEGVILFLILHFLAKQNPPRMALAAVFLMGYGTSRCLIEFVRQPDYLPHLQGGMFEWITMGQILSLPMILLGIALLIVALRRKV